MKPILDIQIDKNNVTEYISNYILSVTYTDNDGLQESASDDVQIDLEDPKYYFRDNPPARGSFLTLRFGYDDVFRNAGSFIIDSYNQKESRSGSSFSIKALSKNISKSDRELKSVAYEGKSIKSIAGEIAGRQNLVLDWQGEDITFNRQTQHQSRDLAYIQGLCKRYGFTCKVNNGKLIIHSMDYRFSYGDAYVITRDYISDISIDISSIPEGQVSADYLDPDMKTVTRSAETAGVKASGSVAKENIRVENQYQSNRISKSKATYNKMQEVKGSMTCVGIPNLYAGGRILLEGYGSLDRDYYISKVVHNISRSGYTCNADFCINPKKESS